MKHKLPEFKPIDTAIEDTTISANEWGGQSVTNLCGQLEELHTRYNTAVMLDNPAIALQLRQGIDQLTELLEDRDPIHNKYETFLL